MGGNSPSIKQFCNFLLISLEYLPWWSIVSQIFPSKSRQNTSHLSATAVGQKVTRYFCCLVLEFLWVSCSNPLWSGTLAGVTSRSVTPSLHTSLWQSLLSLLRGFQQGSFLPPWLLLCEEKFKFCFTFLLLFSLCSVSWSSPGPTDWWTRCPRCLNQQLVSSDACSQRFLRLRFELL